MARLARFFHLWCKTGKRIITYLMSSWCHHVPFFSRFFVLDISKSHDLFSLQDQLRRYRMATRVFFSTFEMPRNVNLKTNLKFSLRIPRQTKDYRQDNQKINRNILVELKCYYLSMFPRRSILGVWNLNIFLCMPRITLFSGNFCRCFSEYVLKMPVHLDKKRYFPGWGQRAI